MNVENELLKSVQENTTVNSLTICKTLNVAHQVVVGALKSLENDGYLSSTVVSVPQWKLNPEAELICSQGSPEFRMWEALEAGPVEQVTLKQMFGPQFDSGLGNGMKAKLFKIAKSEGKTLIARNDAVKNLKDGVRLALGAAIQGLHVDPSDAENLKSRKLAALESVKSFDFFQGPSYAPQRHSKAVTDITKEMIHDGSWATATFKKMNFSAQGKVPQGGHLHPLLKVRQEFREIFLELGFSEMATQQWVESCFWNFDALFVPQKHPARDAQDTFFISRPDRSSDPPLEYLNVVKNVHERGYKCEWSAAESSRNVLRTHTTAVSAWTLYHLAQSAPLLPSGARGFRPGRYFSIDRVFRNEEMDKTHLCEFHQVEGFVVDRNLSLANMMHTLHQFFKRIGIVQLRFKPAYNPYTEPSMEIFGYHAGLKKWMEVGNSGVFRPEMLKPMGFDDDVTAIAWGLSLERPTMIKYGIKNIHELFGHKVDLSHIKRCKIARF